MARVSVFQSYSQRENHATNNTLLAFRYFYRSSPFKLESVLSGLLDVSVPITLSFEQQVRYDLSVPDALITQEPFRLFVETKMGGSLDQGQIRRHIDGIEVSSISGGRDFLLGITREPISRLDQDELAALARKKGITFIAVTFTQVLENLRAGCDDFERELLEIVSDYEAYLGEENLLERRNLDIVVVPCGTSMRENVRFGLYYEPSSRRSKRNYNFIGLYEKKKVAWVGEVGTIANVAFDERGMTFAEEVGVLSDKDRSRIKDAIAASSYYDLRKQSHRFYLVDAFVETSARKMSAGGIMNLRYLQLAKLIPQFDPRKQYKADELAGLLRTATWE